MSGSANNNNYHSANNSRSAVNVFPVVPIDTQYRTTSYPHYLDGFLNESHVVEDGIV